MRRSLALVALAPLWLLAACGDGTGQARSTNPGAPLQVVATTTVIADFAAVIGGERVGVYSLAKPNVDLHDYEPSPADLNAVRSARLVLANGVGLEGWLESTIAASGTKATVLDTSEGVTRRGAAQHDGTAGTKGPEHDPHIWLDPRNAQRMVTVIAKGFAAADPDGAALYEKNLAAYLVELDALDRDIAATVATLPNRKLVTNHDAFGYFVDRYGFDLVGSIIPSFDSSAELSASDLRALVATIKAEGVTAIFSETSLPAKTADTIGREAGVKVVAGEDALYGDGLGPAGSAGGTYLKMMRHNASTIVENLR